MKRKLPVIVAILLVFVLVGCVPSTPNTSGTSATTAGANNATHFLTKEEVKEIVFNHAAVKADSALDLEIELDEEDGTVFYDLEFDHGINEYDYRVDALSGKIIYSKAEPKETVPAETKPVDVQPEETKPAETKPAEEKPAETKPADIKTTSTSTSKKKIGVTKAKNAAFKHANVKASEAWDVEVDLDTENGKLVYEVSFDAGGYDYDYDIDAYTGKVIRSEKERDE